MSEQPGQPWGMCAAFGCPLLGTVGGTDGQWYCFCHLHKPSSLNDAITAALRGRLAPIVDTTLDIRRCGGSFHTAPDVYRAIQRRLIAAGRRDLCFGENADISPHRPNEPIVKMWLARLEAELIMATSALGAARRTNATAQTALLDGPTHAAEFVEKAREAIATSPRVLDIEEREPGSDDEETVA